MFVVLYRWKIKPDFEEQFIKAWSDVTNYYITNFDSLGSRLHRGEDGIFYAYAQWKSSEQRKNAFKNRLEMPAREKMKEAIAESLESIEFEILSDLLKFDGESSRSF